MSFNFDRFVAQVRHADAILATLADPKSRGLLDKLRKQLGLNTCYTVYGKEVALTHLLPTLMWAKQSHIVDKDIADRIAVMRNALAHAGEFVDAEQRKPNVEFDDSSSKIIFRSKNDGGKEVCFKDIEELADFVVKMNGIFGEQVRSK